MVFQQGAEERRVDVETLTLHIHGFNIHIESDDPHTLAGLAQLYAAFRTPVSGHPHLTIRIRCRTSASGDPPALAIGHPWEPLPALPYREAYICERVQQAILERLTPFLPLHAACISRNGQGTLLAGESHHGKSTLALALALRQVTVLGDEVALLHPAEERLYPFPRALSLRPDTLHRLARPDLARMAQPWGDRLLLDLAKFPTSHPRPAPVAIRHVIFLESAHGPPSGRAQQGPFWLFTEPTGPAFIHALAALPGVRHVIPMGAGQVEVHPRPGQRTAAMRQAEQLCRQAGIPLLNLIRTRLRPPAFENESRLLALPPSQGVCRLLNHCLTARPAGTSGKHGQGEVGQLLMQLARGTRGAVFHRLTLGPLPQMLAHLDRLLSSERMSLETEQQESHRSFKLSI